MASSLSIIGMNSGLPSNIVDQLMQAEGIRKSAYKAKKSELEDQKSSFSELESKLSSFKTMVETLKESATWKPRTASSSDDKKIAISASSDATAASHSVKVHRLATNATMMAATGVTNKEATLTSGSTISFTYNGGSYSVAASAGDTLEGVAEKINQLDFGDEEGVNAAVIFDGSSYRLSLAAEDSGAYQRDATGTTTQQRINSVAMTSSLNFSDGSQITAGGFYYTDQGVDAQLTVNGLTNIFSSSNTVNEVIPGVTMTLKGVTDDGGANAPVSLTIANDTSKLQDQLKSFVDSYNAIVEFVSSEKEGNFAGEASTRSIISQLRSQLNQVTGGVTGSYNSLSALGLKTDQYTGKISLDSTKLSAALKSDYTSVAQIFTNEPDSGNDGLAIRLSDTLDKLTDSSTGLIAGKQKGLSSRITMYESRIEREEVRLEKVRSVLLKKFTALEQMSGSLKNASNALMSI